MRHTYILMEYGIIGVIAGSSNIWHWYCLRHQINQHFVRHFFCRRRREKRRCESIIIIDSIQSLWHDRCIQIFHSRFEGRHWWLCGSQHFLLITFTLTLARSLWMWAPAWAGRHRRWWWWWRWRCSRRLRWRRRGSATVSAFVWWTMVWGFWPPASWRTGAMGTIGRTVAASATIFLCPLWRFGSWTPIQRFAFVTRWWARTCARTCHNVQISLIPKWKHKRPE